MEEESAGTPHAEIKAPSIEEEKKDNCIIEKRQESNVFKYAEIEMERKVTEIFTPSVGNITEAKSEIELTCESPDLRTEDPELTGSDANLKIIPSETSV